MPLPKKYGGQPELWEDWPWNFKAYVSVHNSLAAELLTKSEVAEEPITDALLVNSDEDVAKELVKFRRQLHYLLALLTKDSAKLVVRQLLGVNGFETWKQLSRQFSLPGATRHVGLLCRVLKPSFSEQTFEQDFQQWEAGKTTYETQTGTLLPDSVLVAILLNETSGTLQQHFRLNAATLKTYQDVRRVIVQYHQSQHVLKQTTLPASSQGP